MVGIKRVWLRTSVICGSSVPPEAQTVTVVGFLGDLLTSPYCTGLGLGTLVVPAVCSGADTLCASHTPKSRHRGKQFPQDNHQMQASVLFPVKQTDSDLCYLQYPYLDALPVVLHRILGRFETQWCSQAPGETLGSAELLSTPIWPLFPSSPLGFQKTIYIGTTSLTVVPNVVRLLPRTDSAWCK